MLYKKCYVSKQANFNIGSNDKGKSHVCSMSYELLAVAYRLSVEVTGAKWLHNKNLKYISGALFKIIMQRLLHKDSIKLSLQKIMSVHKGLGEANSF